ncbi:MAG: cytochrome c5 family protein [Betaproteobacteria bacterium]|nr:cytochrome c5 family protein [Betaproteobacteria bacterium]
MSADEHQPLIKTPRQLAIVGLLAVLVPVLAAVMIAYFVVTSSKEVGGAHSSLRSEDVAKRIAPVANVVIAETGSDPVKGMRGGEEVYKSVCSGCHATGAAGAPKFGDKAAWGKLIAKGQQKLVADAIKGVRAMPPRGGGADLSDAEFEAAVVHMGNAAGASFKEPPPPKGAAAKAAK